MMGESWILNRIIDPSGIGKLMIGASGFLAAAVNSRGALRSSDCRWIVSRLSERYLCGRPPVCRCCCAETFSVFASRQSASEVWGVNVETTGGSAEALTAGAVAGQRLAAANRPKTATSNSSVLNEDEWGIVLNHPRRSAARCLWSKSLAILS